MRFLAVLLLSAVSLAVAAEDNAGDQFMRGAGHAVGSFGAGAGDAVSSSLWASQPYWVTVNPREKADCMKESKGMVDMVFMRCRNGYEAQVVKLNTGEMRVLQTRKLKDH